MPDHNVATSNGFIDISSDDDDDPDERDQRFLLNKNSRSEKGSKGQVSSLPSYYPVTRSNQLTEEIFVLVSALNRTTELNLTYYLRTGRSKRHNSRTYPNTIICTNANSLGHKWQRLNSLTTDNEAEGSVVASIRHLFGYSWLNILL